MRSACAALILAAASAGVPPFPSISAITARTGSGLESGRCSSSLLVSCPAS
jgi:hypothetical protein